MPLVPVRKRMRTDLGRLQEEMDDLFSCFLGDLEPRFFERGRWPAIDIADNESEVLVRAEVAGCCPEDIDISVHGKTLTISGEKKQEERTKEKGFYHIERSYGTFRRELHLPAEINIDEIDAKYKDGILSIMMPKTEKTKTVKVKVKEEK